jgi:hypothetical protein
MWQLHERMRSHLCGLDILYINAAHEISYSHAYKWQESAISIITYSQTYYVRLT